MKFNRNYFVLTVVLFLTEVIIALYVHDNFIRPYVGDFLVVILIYCFVKSFLTIHYFPLAIAVLGFSYVIEFLQYVNIVRLLGLERYELARVVLGTFFEWIDLLAYTLGVGFLILMELLFSGEKKAV